jgi:hypothetical protein
VLFSNIRLSLVHSNLLEGAIVPWRIHSYGDSISLPMVLAILEDLLACLHLANILIPDLSGYLTPSLQGLAPCAEPYPDWPSKVSYLSCCIGRDRFPIILLYICHWFVRANRAIVLCTGDLQWILCGGMVGLPFIPGPEPHEGVLRVQEGREGSNEWLHSPVKRDWWLGVTVIGAWPLSTLCNCRA